MPSLAPPIPDPEQRHWVMGTWCRSITLRNARLGCYPCAQAKHFSISAAADSTKLSLKEEQHEESVGVSGSIEIEEDGEERERTGLDSEVTELNSVTSGSAEEHREQTESGGSEQGTPNEPPQATPGGQ